VLWNHFFLLIALSVRLEYRCCLWKKAGSQMVIRAYLTTYLKNSWKGTQSSKTERPYGMIIYLTSFLIEKTRYVCSDRQSRQSWRMPDAPTLYLWQNWHGQDCCHKICLESFREQSERVRCTNQILLHKLPYDRVWVPRFANLGLSVGIPILYRLIIGEVFDRFRIGLDSARLFLSLLIWIDVLD